MCHHTAMSWQVVLSMLLVAFAWGWISVAGALALSWGALLRADELLERSVVTARR